MKKRLPEKQDVQAVPKKEIHRRSFIAFASFIGLNILGYETWKWLYHAPAETPSATAGAKTPLRKALDQTETAFRKTFSNNHLVKTFPRSMAAKKVRVNSMIGIRDKTFDPATWLLTVRKNDGSDIKISLPDLMKLPKTEIVYDFKCVEGWDQISHWGGVKFSDFIQHYNLQQEAGLPYVGLVTPDEKYYVGIDTPSAMHPQTLLAYEVNGKLLPVEHGQPLRLIIPVKYGIKNLKRIGTLFFSEGRPRDYWAERGYDYYSGL